MRQIENSLDFTGNDTEAINCLKRFFRKPKKETYSRRLAFLTQVDLKYFNIFINFM